MEYKSLSKEELVKLYRDGNNKVKKQILGDIADNKKFAWLISSLPPAELIQMAKIHPSKEKIVDTMIGEMESHGSPMTRCFAWKRFQRDIFEMFSQELQKESFFSKIRGFITKQPALPETLPKKIEQMRKLCEYEERRNNATGKKVEQRENQSLNEAVDKPRVELNTGEMANLFDKCVRKYGSNGMEQYVQDAIAKEYTEILGDAKSDVAQLIAKTEYENLRSGARFHNPYSPRRAFGNDYNDYSENDRAGVKDTRSWKKNLLEVEQIDNYTVNGQNLGTVFVVKSELNPTDYAIRGKWAPIQEYYTKSQDGQFNRIGSGIISNKTGKMETTISTNGNYVLSSDVTEEQKQSGEILQFDSTEYAGDSTKTSRKDIEQQITMHSIGEHFGKGKMIADVTQVKDIPITKYDENANHQMSNVYMVAYVEDGIESYEMVYIDKDGKCQPHNDMKKDMFSRQKDLCFPTGAVTGLDNKTSMNLLDKKSVLETFKTREGTEYSAYRDKERVLRVAQLLEYSNGNGKYAEELDTYSVIHQDIDRIKAISKEQREDRLQVRQQQGLKVKENDTDNRLTDDVR